MYFLFDYGSNENNNLPHPSRREQSGGHNLETPLTEKGELQATSLGHQLKNKNTTFDVVYISTAVRTKETARIALHEIQYDGQVIETSEVLEQGKGDFEGKLKDMIYQRQDIRKQLDENNWEFVPGDINKGESQKITAARMGSFMKQILTLGHTHIAVFTHGGAIAFYLAELLDRPRAMAYKQPIENASVHCLEFNSNGEFKRYAASEIFE